MSFWMSASERVPPEDDFVEEDFVEEDFVEEELEEELSSPPPPPPPPSSPPRGAQDQGSSHGCANPKSKRDISLS
jgi:hypothetical protein